MFMTNYSKTKEYDQPLYLEPQSTQELFPVKAIDSSGIFVLKNNKYSKMFALSDLNFAGMTDMEQKTIIINFSKVLNALTCRFSFTVSNDYVDEHSFNNRILYKLWGDELDGIRKAFNDVIREKVTEARQGLFQTIYVTLTVEASSLKEAEMLLASNETTLANYLIQIGINGIAGSTLRTIGINERMLLWYDFTHSGLNTNYQFDYYELMKKNKDWIDVVSPEHISFYNDYFVLNGNRYGRVMYISKHPQSLNSDIISELTKINATNYISINSEILDLSALNDEITRKYSSVGLKIEREKQIHRNNNDYLSDASDKLLKESKSLDNLARDVESGDDHYFNTTIMIMFLAKDMDELEEITSKIKAIGGIKSFEVMPCFCKQREGLNSTYMFGVQEFKRVANFSSPCQAMYIPFKTQELNDDGGYFHGINKLSHNPIFANRKKLPAGHGMILGSTGSGKSVYAKLEIISNRCVEPNDNIIIIDPLNEYQSVANIPGINGSIVSFDSSKGVYANPLDVNFDGVDYATLQEIIAIKADFVITLLSSCMRRTLDAEEEGILDKIVEQVYSENYALRKKLNGETDVETEFSVPSYMLTDTSSLPVITNMSPEEQERNYSPLLQDIYQRLLDQEKNMVAQKLAAHMQIFVNGSLNLFNHRTNVDLNNKFSVFELTDIKGNLYVTSMLVMLEIAKNKMRNNKKANEWTLVYIDEFHELLSVPAVADYTLKWWKEARHDMGIMTGISQNMTDLINNSPDSAKLTGIFGNTQYFAFLNQSTIDRGILTNLLPSISPAMFNYVEGAAPGTGLIKMGSITIPFDSRISKECLLYKYVNTDGMVKLDAS